MKQLAYYDGAFLPLDTYAVHLEDRGFQFGDGVFETIRVYGGKCFALEEHLERYRRSMRELAIPITDADAELVGVFYELIEKAEIADGVIYFQLTRGTSPRSYLPPKINLPHLRERLIASDALAPADCFDLGILKDMLCEKFDQIDYPSAKEDVRHFIRDEASLDLWNADFFKAITAELH